MKTNILKLPNISTCMKYIQLYQLGADISIMIIFKSSIRDNNVFVDIYRDDISDTNKIISGKLVTLNSCICQPNNSMEFPYYINCYDLDGKNLPLNQDTLHNFYFQFTSYDDGHLIDTETVGE